MNQTTPDLVVSPTGFLFKNFQALKYPYKTTYSREARLYGLPNNIDGRVDKSDLSDDGIENIWAPAFNIYNELVATPHLEKDYNYVKSLFELATNMFGDFIQWVNFNISSPFISHARYEYILDTLTYILTGKRNISQLSYLMLLDRPSSNNMPMFSPKDRVNYRDLLGRINSFVVNDSTSNITTAPLARWIAHEGGITDMATALYILYGVNPKN